MDAQAGGGERLGVHHEVLGARRRPRHAAEPYVTAFGGMPGAPAGAQDLVMPAAALAASGLRIHASDSVPGQRG